MSLALTRRNGSPYWYIRGTIAGHHVNESTKTKDLALATEYANGREAAIYRESVINVGKTITIEPEMNKELLALADRANNRSQKRRRSEKITRELVQALFVKQRGRCAVSGIPFHLTGEGKHRAFAPSLDRIDNRLGYIAMNVRLVCRIANFAMNIWGDEALLELSKGVVSTWESACELQFNRANSVHEISVREGEAA